VFAVFGPDKNEITKGEVPVFEKQQVAVKANVPGIYTLVVDSGSNAVAVKIENTPAVLKGSNIHFLGAARRPLCFFVPKSVSGFEITLEGEGAETGAIDVLNPEGKVAATGSTVPKGFVKLSVAVPPALAGNIWSVVVKPAESGISEDIRLTLDAKVPPYLATDAASLLVPAD
jgi:hypothetical protein